jgi:AraC-like DNA-binding protein
LRRQIRAGTVGIAPAGAVWTYKTEGIHTSLNLAIADESIQSFAAQEFDHSGLRVELEGTLETSRPPDLFGLGLSFSRLIQFPKRGSALYFQTLWIQILLQLLWHHSTLSPTNQISEVLDLSSDCISVAISFMHETLNQDISLSAISDQVGLSPGYFLRAFKKSTGKTPMQFRADLRIDKACELLRTTAIDLSSISSFLGFASPSQFSTAFKRRMGCAPSVFRREVR